MAYIDSIEWNNLRRVLQEYGDYFIQLARNDLGANGSNASFALNDSMRTIVNIFDDRMEVDIELEDYWYYVEHGRKAGGFPPVNKIKEWIIAKPIMPTTMTITRKWTLKDGTKKERKVDIMPTVTQLAFAIRHKIGTKGTDPQPFFEKNIEPTYEHFQDAIAYAIDADLGEYVERVVQQQLLYDTLFPML